MHIDDATGELLAAGRRLGARGLISAAEGNLSIRLDAERLLITPAGRRKDELGADDLIVLRSGDGHDPGAARSRSGLSPSSDLRIHLAVHRARPDLSAVAHAHLPASMALTLAGETPDPAALPETAMLLPRLPVLPYGEMGSQDLAERVAETLAGDAAGPVEAVILERHGAVAVGPNATIAVDRLELIEVLCRTWLDALLARAARAQLGEGAIVGAPDNQPATSTVEG
jgi:L-fuculose-phosphate aldolase